MNKNKIDITGFNLVKLAQEAYNLSEPMGAGIMDFTEDPLSDEEAQELVDVYSDDDHVALCMDYIKGRSCKLTVRREYPAIETQSQGGTLWIRNDWPDHTPEQLEDLLNRVRNEKISPPDGYPEVGAL